MVMDLLNAFISLKNTHTYTHRMQSFLLVFLYMSVSKNCTLPSEPFYVCTLKFAPYFVSFSNDMTVSQGNISKRKCNEIWIYSKYTKYLKHSYAIVRKFFSLCSPRLFLFIEISTMNVKAFSCMHARTLFHKWCISVSCAHAWMLVCVPKVLEHVFLSSIIVE